MNGRPVWLASVGLHDRQGNVIATTQWPDEERERVRALIDKTLDNLGDESREVEFRMMITLCRHRGLSREEEEGLPASFHEAPAVDTAGASIELLSVKGVSGDAIKPCMFSKKEFAFLPRQDIWLPVPCGKCKTCRAREALRQ